MNLLIKCCPDRSTLCLAANVLVQIAVLAALAWLLASAAARHRPALRHGIWLCALLCILLSPAVSYVAAPAGLSLISLPLLPRPASTAVELPPPRPPANGIEPSLLTASDTIVSRSPALRAGCRAGAARAEQSFPNRSGSHACGEHSRRNAAAGSGR